MIIFQNDDKKISYLKKELEKLGVDSRGVVVKHPVLTPFFILKILFQRKRVKVFVFRYINDSSNFILAVIRLISDLTVILISKIMRIKIWWLCHNVDKETVMFYPQIINLRRTIISNHSSLILTTNKLLIESAQRLFPNNRIDSISLGYMAEGALNLKKDEEEENRIFRWILERSSPKSKFVFCVGSPAKKALHFDLIPSFINSLNKVSSFKWYAVVVGRRVNDHERIYNVPYRMSLNRTLIKRHADYFYRVIDDYSMSYSIFEAVNLRIPIITENYGILPKVINNYKIGVVVDSTTSNFLALEDFVKNTRNFEEFEEENNWETAARIIYGYYHNL